MWSSSTFHAKWSCDTYSFDHEVKTGHPFYYDSLGNCFYALPRNLALNLLGVAREGNAPHNFNLLRNLISTCLRAADVPIAQDISQYMEISLWRMSIQMGLALLPILRHETHGVEYPILLRNPEYYLREIEQIQEMFVLQQAGEQDGGTPSGLDDADNP
jgi:hypothetical protein